MPLDDALPKVEGLDAVARDFLDQPDKAPEVPPQQVVEGQVSQQAPVEGQAKADEIDWGQFKNPKDLLKSYKEIQGFTTRVSQENAALKAEMQRIREEMEVRQYAQTAPPPPRVPDQKTFDQRFIENPQAAIEEVAMAKAYEMANTQRIAEVLEEEEGKSPADFNERVAYVKMLAQNPQFAALSRSPKGVRMLFNKADEHRKNAIARSAHESLKVIFGEEIDLDKLKTLVRKDAAPSTSQTQPPNPNAYMPDLTGTMMTGADLNQAQNALKVAKDEAVKRGDPGTVAGALLREALLKT